MMKMPGVLSKRLNLFSRVLVLLFVFANSLQTAGGQTRLSDVEVSGSVGGARVSGDSITPTFVPWWGASIKAKIGRPEFKVDYEYFRDTYHVSYAISGNWFIQSAPQKVRPFVYIGGAFGETRSFRLNPDYNLFGISLGTGFTVAAEEGFWIRPELRWKWMGLSSTMLIQPGISVGWRFATIQRSR
jgi:hypothetical protein